MAFMSPEYVRGTFMVGTDRHGEPFAVPEGTPLDVDTEEFVEVVKYKWWARLSAAGYLDSTDWLGPFDSHKEACEAIMATYDVDPDTGEDLPQAYVEA